MVWFYGISRILSLFNATSCLCIHLGSSVLSTETDIDTQLTKAWTAINRLSVIWKSELTDKMKRNFFQAATVPQVCKSTKVYGCTAIGVVLESGWVGSRDVSDPSWVRTWGEQDYCRPELFKAAITRFIGSSHWVEYYVCNEGIHGRFLIPKASHSTSFLCIL